MKLHGGLINNATPEQEKLILEKLEIQEQKIAKSVQNMKKMQQDSKIKNEKMTKERQEVEKKDQATVDKLVSVASAPADLKKKGNDNQQVLDNDLAAKKADALEKTKKFERKMAEMNESMERLNHKSYVNGVHVLSTLRNMIHYVKKGALHGDPRARGKLQDLMSSLGAAVAGK